MASENYEIEIDDHKFMIVRCGRCTEMLFSGGDGNKNSTDEIADALDHLRDCDEVEED